MQLSVTFRHMEPSEALKQYVVDKLQRVRKYFPDPIRAQIVLSLEKYLQKADIIITLHNGLVIKSSELTDDMYSAIDQVMTKIEGQVRRYKDKIRDHRPATGPELLVHHDVVEPVEQTAEDPPGGSGLKIIRSSSFFAKPMSPEEAIMQMDLLGNSFLVFVGADKQDVNVVYRRSDGSYGLIETGKNAE